MLIITAEEVLLMAEITAVQLTAIIELPLITTIEPLPTPEMALQAETVPTLIETAAITL